MPRENISHLHMSLLLNADLNALTEVPAEIGNLSNLVTLHLGELNWNQKQTDSQHIMKIIVVVCFVMHGLCQEVTSNTCTCLCLINADGNQQPKPTWKDLFLGVLNSWKRFKFFDGIVDHGIPNYVKAITKLIKAQ